MPKFAKGRNAPANQRNSILSMWRQLGVWWQTWDEPKESSAAVDQHSLHAVHFSRAADALRDAIMVRPAKTKTEAQIQLRLALHQVEFLQHGDVDEVEHDRLLMHVLAAITSALAVVERGQPALPGYAGSVYGAQPESDDYISLRNEQGGKPA